MEKDLESLVKGVPLGDRNAVFRISESVDEAMGEVGFDMYEYGRLGVVERMEYMRENVELVKKLGFDLEKYDAFSEDEKMDYFRDMFLEGSDVVYVAERVLDGFYVNEGYRRARDKLLEEGEESELKYLYEKFSGFALPSFDFCLEGSFDSLNKKLTKRDFDGFKKDSDFYRKRYETVKGRDKILGDFGREYSHFSPRFLYVDSETGRKSLDEDVARDYIGTAAEKILGHVMWNGWDDIYEDAMDWAVRDRGFDESGVKKLLVDRGLSKLFGLGRIERLEELRDKYDFNLRDSGGFLSALTKQSRSFLGRDKYPFEFEAQKLLVLRDDELRDFILKVSDKRMRRDADFNLYISSLTGSDVDFGKLEEVFYCNINGLVEDFGEIFDSAGKDWNRVDQDYYVDRISQISQMRKVIDIFENEGVGNFVLDENRVSRKGLEMISGLDLTSDFDE